MSQARKNQIVALSVIIATVFVLTVAFGFPNQDTPLFGPLFEGGSPTAYAPPPEFTLTPTPVATETPTPAPPTDTATPALPTDTATPAPPTDTPTPLPPTDTPTPAGSPTNTPTPSATAPPGAAIERVQPNSVLADLSVPTVTTNVTVELASNLGSYEVLVTYDSSIVNFVSAADSGYLGSTGRSVVCQAPFQDVLGPTLRRVHFGCNTFGSVDGPGGSGTLATLTWSIVGPGTTALHLTPSLTDPLGDSTFAVAYDGSIIVSPDPTSTPTPCPGGPCPTNTPTATPTTTPTASPTPLVNCGAAGTMVCVQPIAESDVSGSLVNVKVAVQQATGLGAFQFTLSYDPSVLSPYTVGDGGFLGSTGRTVFCLPAQFQTGSVQFTCVTLGPAPPPGVTGSGSLALVTFIANNPGSTPLSLSSVILTTVSGAKITATTVDGTRTVLPCSGTCPTPPPTFTPTFTATPLATLTATSTPTPCDGPCPTATPTFTPGPTFTPTPVLPTGLRVLPVTQDVFQTGTFSFDVVVDSVADLGAYEIGIDYDPSLVSFVGVTNGSFLGSSGRTVQCPSFSTSSGNVRFGCATLGGDPAGPTGGGVLAHFTFAGTNVGTSALTISDPLVLTRNAAVIALTSVADGSVTVNPCSGPCPTPTSSPTPGTPTATAVPGGIATLGVVPSAVTAPVGTQFSVNVDISNATNVGAYEVYLDYGKDSAGNFEPGVLQFDGFTNGPFLGSTGRPVTCLDPLFDNLSVRIGCVTGGSSPPGASGAGLLATLTFTVLKPSNLPMQLFVDSGSGGLSDPLGVPMSFATDGSTTTVTITTPTGTIPPPAGAAANVTPPSGGTGSLLRAAPRRPAAPGANTASVSMSYPHAGGGASAWTNFASRGDGRIVFVAVMVLGCTLVAVVARREPLLTFVRKNARRRSAVIAAVAAALLAPAVIANATNPVALFKTPSSANVFVGDGTPLVVSENVAPVAAPGLGSFQIEVTYNSSVIALGVREGPFLSSTGNATSCITTYISMDDVIFGCAALGSPASGPTGQGVLAYFDVLPRVSLNQRATDQNGIFTLLHDVQANSVLTDVQGNPIPVESTSDSVIVARRLEGDLNKDCIVNVLDDQTIAVRYGSVFGVLSYDPQYDLEPASTDGDIDIKDVQFVFGRNGSTCEHPVPPQTPPPGETPTIPATTTPTPSATTSVTATPTPTLTETPTVTPSATSTAVTPSPTGTLSPTATAAATLTPTPTATGTSTAVATTTRTATAVASSTAATTRTPAATGTPSQTRTAVPTATNTPVRTTTAVASATAGTTRTPAATATGTRTATRTAVPTATNTPVSTTTPTPTAVASSTPESTNTAAATATETASPTPAASATITGTASPTASAISTGTPASPTRTASATASPQSTESAATGTPAATRTAAAITRTPATGTRTPFSTVLAGTPSAGPTRVSTVLSGTPPAGLPPTGGHSPA
ncbi:MAG TPA: cohesin domain-containing protein, partial [Dehalococcoidia bacterium]|nr:cohesin domain-containing protein [Dehalococcoidia bacterium]